MPLGPHLLDGPVDGEEELGERLLVVGEAELEGPEQVLVLHTQVVGRAGHDGLDPLALLLVGLEARVADAAELVVRQLAVPGGRGKREDGTRTGGAIRLAMEAMHANLDFASVPTM